MTKMEFFAKIDFFFCKKIHVRCLTPEYASDCMEIYGNRSNSADNYLFKGNDKNNSKNV